MHLLEFLDGRCAPKPWRGVGGFAFLTIWIQPNPWLREVAKPSGQAHRLWSHNPWAHAFKSWLYHFVDCRTTAKSLQFSVPQFPYLSGILTAYTQQVLLRTKHINASKALGAMTCTEPALNINANVVGWDTAHLQCTQWSLQRLA